MARLRFADLTFDATTRQVWRDGEEVHLSPKAFELLALLIERRPQAVSKPDIRARLWPGTHVSDSNLPTLVSEVREAIGDGGRPQKLIHTLHTFGYAFRAPADAAPAAGTATVRVHAWLLAPTGDIELARGENILGREGDGVIVIRSTTASRRHVRIVVGEGGVVAEDLGSKNDTFVNDERVTGPVSLVDGDRIRVGSLLFTFRLSQAADTTETQAAFLARPPRD